MSYVVGEGKRLSEGDNKALRRCTVKADMVGVFCIWKKEMKD